MGLRWYFAAPMALRASQVPDYLPSSWYNILADLPGELPPMKLPNGQIVEKPMLEKLFAKTLVEQEYSRERYIQIPAELRNKYLELGRPTPLLRAKNLEEYLGTPAIILYKYEGVTPTGSHKINTALAQAYYNKLEGTETIVTETGAGQWGSALSLAGALTGIHVRVYMVRVSYYQKPYRGVLMRIYGAEVYPSPSNRTSFGRKLLEQNPEHPGSLGIAISEAIEDVVTSGGKAKYCLGSVLNHVLLHQTVIGLEAKKQVEELGLYPDVVIGCVGGGSNYAGLSYPFIYDRLKGSSDTRFIAAEPKAVPSMTRGEYRYDYGDTAGMTPMIKMHTLGHEFTPPPIHAGGLRYHGIAPTLSVLINHGVVEPVAYGQREVFEAGTLFAKLEGIVPAPESAHAVKAVIEEALRAKERGRREVILFNMSGHGLLDLQGYIDFLEGRI